MKALVTGATGFVGYHVALLLRQKGTAVKALVRNESEADFLADLGIEVAAGDVRDIDSVYRAMRGCSVVYHAAADYRLWVPDAPVMYAINVQGTRNMMHAALMLGVRKVVYTSTVGVLAPRHDGLPATEASRASLKQMKGHYKASKFIAEQEIDGFIRKGLPVVVVNPSTPIGAMDRKPTPTGQIIVDFLNGRTPAYVDTGLNIVDVEDVAAGHLLAAERGTVGERYILGNRNVSLRELFGLLASATGKAAPTVRLPYLPVLIAARAEHALSWFRPGRKPRIPLAGVQMAKYCMYFDSGKAVRELGLPQTPVEGAIERAIRWFETHGYVHQTQGRSASRLTTRSG